MTFTRSYDVIIERGHTEVNDRIVSFIASRVHGKYLDIGCNTGFLLETLPGGIGVDSSEMLVKRARLKGLNVVVANAEVLPFGAHVFDTAVLSCVLEQVPDWRRALAEAQRVSKRVIGINPYPGSTWGRIWGWVKSVIPPEEIYGAHITKFDDLRYYFEV